MAVDEAGRAERRLPGLAFISRRTSVTTDNIQAMPSDTVLHTLNVAIQSVSVLDLARLFSKL